MHKAGQGRVAVEKVAQPRRVPPQTIGKLSPRAQIRDEPNLKLESLVHKKIAPAIGEGIAPRIKPKLVVFLEAETRLRLRMDVRQALAQRPPLRG